MAVKLKVYCGFSVGEGRVDTALWGRSGQAFAFGLMLLSGCGAQPAPHMFGADRIAAHRDGRDYVLYQKGEMVEIIRLGYARRGEHQAIRAAMIALIPELTGCVLLEGSVMGDSGEMRGRLSC